MIKIFIIILETHVDIPNENKKELFVRISSSTKKSEIYALDILYMQVFRKKINYLRLILVTMHLF